MTGKHPLLRGLSAVANDLWGSPDQKPVCREEITSAAPSLDDLYARADDIVDWTEALVHAAPTDGLTDPEKWTQYHRWAEAVLSGDREAYEQVLMVCEPLADLAPWLESCRTEVRDASCLVVCLDVKAAYASRRNAAMLGIRAARDLFALLPAERVEMQVRQEEKQLITVCFDRNRLLRERFPFAAPEEVVLRSAGDFPE